MIHCKIILDAKNNNSSNELAPDIIGQERTVTSKKKLRSTQSHKTTMTMTPTGKR